LGGFHIHDLRQGSNLLHRLHRNTHCCHISDASHNLHAQRLRTRKARTALEVQNSGHGEGRAGHQRAIKTNDGTQHPRHLRQLRRPQVFRAQRLIFAGRRLAAVHQHLQQRV